MARHLTDIESRLILEERPEEQTDLQTVFSF
jgi:hypothetical protein